MNKDKHNHKKHNHEHNDNCCNHGYSNHNHNHSHNHHGHSHSHLHHHHGDSDNIGSAFLINALFTVIEIIGGLFTNSTAILSDAIHDLGDTISLGASWILEKKSKKTENDKYTYGYGRLSVVGSLINIIVLSIGTIIVLINTIPRIINPEPVNVKGMLILAIIGVIMNGMAVLKVKNGEKISEKVVMLHLMEDVLGWLAVLIVSTVLVFVDFPVLDPLLSLGISIYIIKNIISNTKIILDIILQTVPGHISIAEMERNVKDIDSDIIDVKNIKCWSLDGEHNVITLEIVLSNLGSSLVLKSKVEKMLKEKYNAKYTSVSVDV